MAVVERVIPVPPDQVFAILADAWTYSDWVVGTAHIRAVDPHWPAPGSRLYHKVGPWPLSVRDNSEVLACTAPDELVVRAKMWPLGEATVVLRLAATGDGGTRVTIAEEFKAGPLRWVQTKINDLVLHARNVETLRRLGDLAIRRASPVSPASPASPASSVSPVDPPPLPR